MINLSITWWELSLLVIALAIVVGTYFFVKFLKGWIQALGSLNSLLSDNKRSLDDIIQNLDEMTRDATKMTDKADIITGELTNTVSTVKQDVVDPLIQVLATLVKVFHTMAVRKSKETQNQSRGAQ